MKKMTIFHDLMAVAGCGCLVGGAYFEFGLGYGLIAGGLSLIVTAVVVAKSC